MPHAAAGPLSREDIAERLDITDPFLMIDTFEVTEPGAAARATRSLDSGDWYFAAHLPREQVMPATLQIEGMLQTLVLLIYDAVEHGAHRAFITHVDVKLVSAAKPEHDIVYDARLISFRRGIARGEVTGSSDGQPLCRGAFTYASPHLMGAPS